MGTRPIAEPFFLAPSESFAEEQIFDNVGISDSAPLPWQFQTRIATPLPYFRRPGASAHCCNDSVFFQAKSLSCLTLDW